MVNSDKSSERVDLHTHTSFSDGEFTPVELVKRAAERDVRALAITDHDTIAAYGEPSLGSIAVGLGVELIPGIEISTVSEEGYGLHVLGLFIDLHSDYLHEAIKKLNHLRQQYSLDVGERLRSFGWALDIDKVLATPSTITKATIATTVIGDPLNQSMLSRVFGPESPPTNGRFIEAMMNPGGPCYTPKTLAIHPREGVEVVHHAGGLAFFAHPVANRHEGMTLPVIEQKTLVYGFDGLEAIYYYHERSQNDREINEVDRFEALARKHNLLISGGSDFHGESARIGKYVDIGFGDRQPFATTALLDSLKRAVEDRKQGEREPQKRLDRGVGTRIL